MGNHWPAYTTLETEKEPEGGLAVLSTNQMVLIDSPEYALDCLIEMRPEDEATGVQFRDCLIDYTRCPNQNCIKKLV